MPLFNAKKSQMTRPFRVLKEEIGSLIGPFFIGFTQVMAQS